MAGNSCLVCQAINDEIQKAKDNPVQQERQQHSADEEERVEKIEERNKAQMETQTTSVSTKEYKKELQEMPEGTLDESPKSFVYLQHSDPEINSIMLIIEQSKEKRNFIGE